jgi:hypothetical protein
MVLMSDFHFYLKPEKKDKSGNPQITGLVKKSLKQFAVLIVLSAALPVFIFFAVNPKSLKFTPQADTSPTLRLWFEPREVILGSEEEAEASIVVDYDAQGKVLTGLSFSLKAEGLVVDPKEYQVSLPLSGKTKAGVVSFFGLKKGEYEITIPEETINYLNKEANIVVETSPLKVIIR